MGFRFQKRINLGGGLGLNVSKSGISPSLKTGRGTISSKGFSVRTGISGVNYQNNFGKAKNSGCMLLVVFTGVATFLIYILK
jgi:hypothetical protein